MQTDKLIIPIDFVVLDMERQSNYKNELPILLGHPFMDVTKTIIDVQNGKLTMIVVKFFIFNCLNLLTDLSDSFFMQIKRKINWS